MTAQAEEVQALSTELTTAAAEPIRSQLDRRRRRAGALSHHPTAVPVAMVREVGMPVVERDRLIDPFSIGDLVKIQMAEIETEAAATREYTA